MKKSCLVIGGGVSGCTAAIIMARMGWRVRLVEKSRRIMPLLRGFKRELTHFDTGFHYSGGFGAGQAMDAYLRFLGVRQHIEPVELGTEEAGGFFDILRFMDTDEEGGFKDIGYGNGWEGARKGLIDQFPDEREAIDTFFDDAEALFRSSPWLNLDVPFGKNEDFFSIEEKPLLPWLDSLTDNERLKAVLSVHCLLYGSPPSIAPFHVHSFVTGSLLETPCAVKGGGRAIADAYETAMAEAGVEVMTGVGVDLLERNSGNVFGKATLDNGEVLEADQCICTVHPRVLAKIAGKRLFRPAFLRRLNALDETPAAHILYGICDEDLSLVDGKNYYVLPKPDIDSFFDWGIPLEQRGLFIAASQGTAPGEKRSLVVISQDYPLEGKTVRGAGYAAYKKDTLKRMEQLFFDTCPEARGKVRFIEGSTPWTMCDWCNTPLGGLYGVMHTVSQFNPLPVTKCPGLFLAGQAVIAPGFMGALVSSFLTCGLFLGAEELRNEVLKCS